MLITIRDHIPPKVKREIKLVLRNTRDSLFLIKERKRQVPENVRHIVFVCKGNICRSAFAEHCLRLLAKSDRLMIESCGFDANQGNSPPKEALIIGREFGVDLSAHSPRGLEVCDLDDADIIIPMEYDQYRSLTVMYPEHKSKITLLRDFAPWPQRLFCNIYDPFGHDLTEFRCCFRGIWKAIERLESFLYRAVDTK